MKLDVAALTQRAAPVTTVARAEKPAKAATSGKATAADKPAAFGFPAPAPRRHATTVSVVTPKARPRLKEKTTKPTARKPATRRKATAKAGS